VTEYFEDLEHREVNHQQRAAHPGSLKRAWMDAFLEIRKIGYFDKMYGGTREPAQV